MPRPLTPPCHRASPECSTEPPFRSSSALPMRRTRTADRRDQGGPSRSDTSSRDHFGRTGLVRSLQGPWHGSEGPAIEATAVEADQDWAFAKLVLRQVADKPTDHLGFAFLSGVPSADAAHSKGSIAL